MFRFGWHVLLCWPQNMTDVGLTMYFKDVQRALHRNQPTHPLLCGHWYQRWVSSPVHMHVTASESRQNFNNVIMGAIASQITSLTIVYTTVYLDADQRKHQSSASLAFVRGIHRWPVNSPHKWPVTRKMFPFDDVIMSFQNHSGYRECSSTALTMVEKPDVRAVQWDCGAVCESIRDYLIPPCFRLDIWMIPEYLILSVMRISY